MQSWGKQDWVTHIGMHLQRGPFTYRSFLPNNAPMLFAVDVYRRRGHKVDIFFEVVEVGPPCIGFVIFPEIESTDITIRLDTNVQDIVERMSVYQTVRIRGCGTTIELVVQIVKMAICRGWYVDKTNMGTLVKLNNDSKHRNTTLMVTLCRTRSPNISPSN